VSQYPPSAGISSSSSIATYKEHTHIRAHPGDDDNEDDDDDGVSHY